MGCHTPDGQGRLDFSQIGAGGNPFGAPNGGVIVSANGVASWTNQQITTGMRPDRPLVRLMAFDGSLAAIAPTRERPRRRICFISGGSCQRKESMLHEIESDDFRARVAEVESRRVALGEVARWFAPWLLAGVLVLIFAGGLWCASSAVDDGAYAVGLAAALFALLALIWELVAAQGSGFGDIAAPLLVDDETSLIVLIALFTVLALFGLVLAARSPSVAASGAGYGLFVFGVAFIFANLKYYFDRRDR
jgi:hypothetical protein